MRISILLKGSLFLLLSLALGFSHAEAVDLSKPIKEIKVAGQQRANRNTIRFYIHSKAGELYSVQKTRDDIRRIYKMGYFDDIKLEVEESPEGPILVYVVKEKPFIQSVKIEGNEIIGTKELTTLLMLKEGEFFQKHIIKRDIRWLKKKYRTKGYYFTVIEPRIKKAGNNQVDVIYHIFDKSMIKVTSIKFNGNSFFKDYDLEEVVDTDAVGFTPFTDTGNFNREILKTDLLKLESKYRDAGFIKVRVEEPRVEVDKQNGMITITFVIHEGDRYMVGSITAKGDKIHTAEEILENVTLKKGDPFNQSLFRANLFSITEIYSDLGYAYAAAIPKVDEDSKTKIVDIDLRVDPGPKVYIGRISITGNDKTKENVIRREFRVHEGEAFSSSKIRRTRQRLINLGFFDELNIDQKSGKEPDLLDLGISVYEKSTGNIRAGFGFSSTESLTMQLEITERNLFGTGRNLSLGMDTSILRNDYFIDFTDPRFRDREILVGAKIFIHEFDFTSYTSKSKGGGLRAGKALGEFSRVRLEYTLENVEVIIDELASASDFLAAQKGTRLTSHIKPTVSKNTVDNYLNPTMGYKLNLSTQVAGGPLGGDLDFYKAAFTAQRYYPLPLEFVFMTKAKIQYAASYGNQTLPVFEHYFLGGPSSLRGFSFQDVGPLDNDGDAQGGDSSLLFNFEINYMFSKAMRGVLFYDRGQVYGDKGDLAKTTSNRYNPLNMRHSVGFGMRFITPMAPISLIWGFKLDPKEGETVMEFHFSLGGAF